MCNYWWNGETGGHYSLLPHARALEIRDNPRAVRDLAAYAAGAYRLGAHWQR